MIETTNLWIQTCSSLWYLCPLGLPGLRSWTSSCLCCTTSSLGAPWSGPLLPGGSRGHKKEGVSGSRGQNIEHEILVNSEAFVPGKPNHGTSVSPWVLEHTTIPQESCWLSCCPGSGAAGAPMLDGAYWKSWMHSSVAGCGPSLSEQVNNKDRQTLHYIFYSKEHGEFWCSGKSSGRATFPGLLLSPSLGSALRDWVRLFTGDIERGGSGTTPGRKLKGDKKQSVFINFTRYQ